MPSNADAPIRRACFGSCRHLRVTLRHARSDSGSRRTNALEWQAGNRPHSRALCLSTRPSRRCVPSHHGFCVRTYAQSLRPGVPMLAILLASSTAVRQRYAQYAFRYVRGPCHAARRIAKGRDEVPDLYRHRAMSAGCPLPALPRRLPSPALTLAFFLAMQRVQRKNQPRQSE